MALSTFAIIASILLAIAIQRYSSLLLPYGPARPLPPHRGPHHGPQPDPTNTSLRLSSGKLTKIYERLDGQKKPKLVKPETIVLDGDGNIYFLNEDADLISLRDIRSTDDPHIWTAEAVEVAHLGVGRPLSAKFDNEGCLYYVDVILGLGRTCLNQPHPKVELLASRARLKDGSWSPINYADDVDIGPKTGRVYFSDASDARPERDATTGKWDIVYPSKVEGVRWNMSGRLLRYDPSTGEVDVLAAGASFANGVAVDRDENYVLYVSTFDRAVMKYHLQGEKAGETEKVLDQFPGLLDGIDCSFQSGKCYVAIVGAVSSPLAALFSLPSFLSVTIRSFLLLLPKKATPDAAPYGGFAEIDPGSDDSPPRILRLFQDPDGRDVEFVTGVTEFGGKVYLGSLHNDFVGVYNLN